MYVQLLGGEPGQQHGLAYTRVAMNSKFWTNMNMNIIQSQKNFEYEYE